MACYSHVPMEDILYDVPFSLPTNLPNDAYLSSKLVDTLATAELYMRNKEYLTAAAIYTVALRRIGVPASLALVASLVCNRAECLLYMNYVQDVFRNCYLVMDLLGGVNEHAAFLLMRAHEMQGEIQEAFCYAITYQSLDPELNRDKNAVERVREKVVLSFGQGPHEISWTINNLMFRGIKLLEENQTNLALSYFTEVLAFFPSLQEAFEYRARCFLIQGDFHQAKEDCNRALQVSERRSGNAFAIKVEIMMQAGELKHALEATTEWRRIDPTNRKIDEMVQKIEEKMHEMEAGIRLNRSQSLSDVSLVSRSENLSKTSNGDTTSVKRSEYQAPKWSSGAGESEVVAQEMEEKRRQEEKKVNQDRVHCHADEERHSISQESAATTTQERRKRKKRRRKARRRRKQGDDMEDNSDASSTCSISTCPGDLDLTKGATPSKLPNVDDSWSVQVSRRRSRSRQTQRKPFTSIPTPQVHSSGSPGNKNKRKEQGVVRTLPSDVRGTYRLCIYHWNEKTCFQGEKCPFAHSEVERKAWEQQRKEASRNHQREREGKPSDMSGTKPLSLKELRQAFQGTCRPPLRKLKAGQQYKICPRWVEGLCKLKDKCIFAHGEKERKEWNEHLKRMVNEMKKGTVGENSVQQTSDPKKESEVIDVLPLSNDSPAPTYKSETLVHSLSGVTFTSEPRDLHVSLQVPLHKEGVNNYSWTINMRFQSKTSGHLQHITLLPQHHKCFSLSAVRFKCSVETMASNETQPVVKRDFEKLNEFYSVPPYLRELHGSCEVDITVIFSSSVFGNFSQLVVFDFGQRSHLALDLSIDVGSQEFLSAFAEGKSKLIADWSPWDNGSMKVIAFHSKISPVFDNEGLLSKYKLPLRPEDIVPSPILIGSGCLSKENYKDVMHQLLFVEESYIRKQVARFNEKSVKLNVSNFVVKTREALWAPDGSLFGYFHISHAITPDDAPGRLLLRNVFDSGGSVLLAKSDCINSTAYEALADSVEDNRVIVKLSEQCCEDLSLFNNSEITVDVQFQINRLSLCEMHDNIDRLGPEHVRILFPQFSNNVPGSEEEVTLCWILDQTLNEQQQCVIKTVAKPLIKAPPLVLFGPFGTGKTFTLSQAVRQIVLHSNNRVLICTHSNSAADLHVTLLDDYLRNQHGIKACRPLRIYTPLRKMSNVSDEVKEYCLIRDHGNPSEAFRLPTLDDLLDYRVIVTTLTMSRALFDMNLHRGFFSHILIDEAAQALETEILAPITLAGYSTKVIFTGDHMQMSPDVFSDQAKKWGLQTSLPQRLFHDYKARQKEGQTNTSLIFLTKNYRSHEQVLQFSSEMFYGGKLLSDVKQPLHPWLGPLLFYSALGREELDESCSSYRNLAEVNEVVRRVKELVDNWPEQWGPRNLQEIAVLSSYRYQVQTIRDGLRKNGIGAVDVETVENVQGKQFRAIFISTVRTYHTRMLGGGESACLHFLSDPRLLNTALTRAQSLIAVIGDPFSLRTMGECQVLWEDFINRCSRGGMLFGIEHKELEEAISRSGLNIHAPEFVPETFARSQCSGQNSNEQPKAHNHAAFEKDESGPNVEASEAVPISSAEVCLDGSESCTTLSAKKCHSNATDNTDSFANTCHSIDDCQVVQVGNNTDPSESKSDYSAEDEDNEPCVNKDNELLTNEDVINADELAGRAADEAVPPMEMDDIILAMKEICVEQRKQEDKAKGNTQELKYFCSATLESKNSQIADKNVVHEDLEMTRRKGVTQVQLVNLPTEYSKRANRLHFQPRDRAPGHLDIEHLDRLLRDVPQEYRLCTLSINYQRSPHCYGYTKDTESKDIQIEGRIRQCFDGDVAVVKLQNECKDEIEGTQDTSDLVGKIVGVRNRVICPRGQQFVCRISKRNSTVMIPMNKSFPAIANARDEGCKGIPIYERISTQGLRKRVKARILPMSEASSGKHLFLVQYLQWRPEFPNPLGIVTKTISKGHDLPCSLNVLDIEYGLKKTFPEEVRATAFIISNLLENLLSQEKKKRELVENAFTIDPLGSKALDDALSVEKSQSGKYRVGIHITDVSYFVEPGSAVDNEARKRGTSYFRGHGEESSLMLPEHLSHDTCSLLPNKERLAVSVYLDMDKHGGIVETVVRRTIVKSRCQLTYNEVQKMILKKATDSTRIPDAVFRSVRLLSRLAQKLRNVRIQEGSFNHFDHKDRKKDFEAHELVEEFMILANRTVANYLVEGNVPFAPLRIQLPPKKHKIEEWNENFGRCAKFSLSLRRHLLDSNSEFAESFRVEISTWNAIIEAVCSARRSGEYRELRLLVCNDNIYPQLAVAQSRLRRIQRKAEYVLSGEVPLDHIMHWSLNVSKYTHFTSPIRRYIDIEVHRLLLQHAKLEDHNWPPDISELCRQCSFLEGQSAKFEKACRTVKFASKLKERSEELSAFVNVIGRDYIQLQLQAEVNDCIPQKQKRIRISHLGPIKQPHFDETLESLTLQWSFRVYDLSDKRRIDAYSRLREESNSGANLLCANECDTNAFFNIPSELWLKVLDAIQTKDDSHLLRCLEKADSSKMEEMSSSGKALLQTKVEENNAHHENTKQVKEGREKEEEVDEEQEKKQDDDNDICNDEDDDDNHDDNDDEDDDEDDGDDDDEDVDEDDDEEKEEEEEQDNYNDDDNDDENEEEEEDASILNKMMTLRSCDSLNIQLSVNSREEVLSPAVQLLTLSPELSICLEHHRFESKCFALTAQNKASRKYPTIDAYINAWKSLLDMEAATVAVRNDDAFRLLNLDVEWKGDYNDFQSNTISCKTRDIKILEGEETVVGAFQVEYCEEMLSVGDFVCARIPYTFFRPAIDVLSTREQLLGAADSQEENEENADETMSESSNDYETASEGEEDKEGTFSEKTHEFGGEIRRRRKKNKTWWVGHCVVTRKINQIGEPVRFALQLFQCSSRIPPDVFKEEHVSCNLEIIRQTVSHKRMIETLINLKNDLPTPLAEICLGGAFKLEDHRVQIPEDNLSVAEHHPDCGLRALNDQQHQAVRLALRKPFILIQGPPGTGKTLTGVHIAYWFAQMNRNLAPSEKPRTREAPPQVLYCGPSNKSVDVVAEYLLKIPGLKILRVYGSFTEQAKYPIPNSIKPIRKTQNKADLKVPENLREVALHFVIRNEKSPKAEELKKLEGYFAAQRKKKPVVDPDKVSTYKKLIADAEKHALQKEGVQIILCTCTTAGGLRIASWCDNIIQCIVDESGMCMEPETLIPIASSKASQVVLIGDHKQLQPVVMNGDAGFLGLSTSLFERYSNHAFMLLKQYRMHKEICEFPSKQFYDGQLETPYSVAEREEMIKKTKEYLGFWPSWKRRKAYVPLVFCDVIGEEEELVVTTEEGGQKSKSNIKEKEKVVEVANKLVNSCGVKMQEIVILSPYRAQCQKIREGIRDQGLHGIPVMSITKSQGSEWDFVIISLVRSLPDSKIEPAPSRYWLRENLGFVTDEHQINVALTRAKRGLCIVGNKKLLRVYELWDQLIRQYESKFCLVDDTWPRN